MFGSGVLCIGGDVFVVGGFDDFFDNGFVVFLVFFLEDFLGYGNGFVSGENWVCCRYDKYCVCKCSSKFFYDVFLKCF